MLPLLSHRLLFTMREIKYSTLYRLVLKVVGSSFGGGVHIGDPYMKPRHKMNGNCQTLVLQDKNVSYLAAPKLAWCMFHLNKFATSFL